MRGAAAAAGLSGCADHAQKRPHRLEPASARQRWKEPAALDCGCRRFADDALAPPTASIPRRGWARRDWFGSDAVGADVAGNNLHADIRAAAIALYDLQGNHGAARAAPLLRVGPCRR